MPVTAAFMMIAMAQSPAPADKFLTQPLVRDLYTADPSAHVFNGTIYIYPSHDIDAGVPADDLGSHFAMRDYHVFSMKAIGGPVTDHGVALDIKDVPWAGRQMWAPDAATKAGKYYLYFPVKDKQDVFRIGVAVGDKPTGPFKAAPQPIAGSFSIDPAVFTDSDGKSYMYFGGIWGGQLQRWATGSYSTKDVYPAKDQAALSAKIARLGDDMMTFAEAPKDVVLLDEQGKPLTAGDNSRRFFEASWVHKYKDTYYFSVLDRRHALHHVRHGEVSVRPLHRARQDPRARPRLDQPSLHHRVSGEVVPLLPRRSGLGRPDAPAQHQDDGTEVSRRRHDCYRRCVQGVIPLERCSDKDARRAWFDSSGSSCSPA